ncbi:PAS domain S-box protein [Bacillus sp. AK128]
MSTSKLNPVLSQTSEIDYYKQENEKLRSELATYKDRLDELSNSHSMFEQLFNHISDAVYFYKIDSNGYASKFLEINTTAYQRLGYTREEMLGLSPFDIDCHTEAELLSLVRDHNTILETAHVCKNGDHVPVEIYTSLIEIGEEKYFLSVCRDNTEKKKVELEIRTTREQYKRLVESSTHGIAVLEDGKWTYANEATLKLFGAKTKEELLGKDVYDMLHPEFHADCKAIINKGGVHKRLKRNWTTLDGRELQTEVVSIPFPFRQGQANQLIIQDLTELKQAQHMMIQAEKMNVIGQLAAGIAHEIRNPLTSLKGFVQLFIAGTVPNDTFLSIMQTELDRIDIISNEFLTLAKPGNINFIPLNLKELLQNVVNLLETELFRHSVTLEVNFDHGDALVNGEATQLKQVFINLIKNAFEVMPNGGTITIHLELRDTFAFVSIIDEGSGMTEEQLRRIGEPFFTTKENGTGLGLMVSYTIIENHKGEIGVESKLNEGTTFTVKLPLLQ